MSDSFYLFTLRKSQIEKHSICVTPTSELDWSHRLGDAFTVVELGLYTAIAMRNFNPLQKMCQKKKGRTGIQLIANS